LGSQHFNNTEDLMWGVKTWLSSQAADFSDKVYKNLYPDMTNVSMWLRWEVAYVCTHFLYITIIFSHCLLC
jgi:hypothetical protein